MKRAMMAAVLALLAAGCFDEINYIHRDLGDGEAPAPPVKCDAGEVAVEQPAPNIPKCEPSDAGTDGL